MPGENLNYPERFPEANWSVVFQIAAESDLITDMIAIYDKIASIGSVFGKVNLIVLYDGMKIETLEFPENPSVYYVRQSQCFSKDSKYPVLSFKDDNLTDPRLFNTVMSAIITKFPAQHWAYFYCGHGAAGGTDITNGKYIIKLNHRLIIKGQPESDEHMKTRLSRLYEKDGWEIDNITTLDESIGGFNLLVILVKEKNLRSLSYHQLSLFLKEVFKEDLRFICLDTCWGQLTENNLAFMGVADYLVASVDEMPVKGIGYEGFCRLLADNPEIIPFELASVITSTFYQCNYNDYLSGEDFHDMGVSLSCVDLKNFRKLVDMEFGTLVGYLTSNMPRLRKTISCARTLCKDHTYSPEDEFEVYNIDLVWFLENLIWFIKDKDSALVNMCLKVISGIKLYVLKAFIANNYGVNEVGKKPALGGYGYTISFPSNIEEYRASIYSDDVKKEHAHLHKDWIWKDFLQAYLGITSKMDNGYSKSFASEGAFYEYAEYYTSSKSDNLIISSVKSFAREITSQPDITNNTIFSKNKWRKP